MGEGTASFRKLPFDVTAICEVRIANCGVNWRLSSAPDECEKANVCAEREKEAVRNGAEGSRIQYARSWSELTKSVIA